MKPQYVPASGWVGHDVSEDVVDVAVRFLSMADGVCVAAALAADPVIDAVAISVISAEMEAAIDAVPTLKVEVTVATADSGGPTTSGVGALRIASKSKS